MELKEILAFDKTTIQPVLKALGKDFEVDFRGDLADAQAFLIKHYTEKADEPLFSLPSFDFDAAKAIKWNEKISYWLGLPTALLALLGAFLPPIAWFACLMIIMTVIVSIGLVTYADRPRGLNDLSYWIERNALELIALAAVLVVFVSRPNVLLLASLALLMEAAKNFFRSYRPTIRRISK